MKVSLQHNSGFHFTGQDENGNEIQIDGKRQAGNSPMNLLLYGSAACSGIDIVSILEKMRQKVDDFKVDTVGDRETEGDSKIWKSISMNYQFKGDIEPAKAKKAITLSLEKYCSVTKMLGVVAKIYWSCELNGEMLAENVLVEK